MKKKKNKLTYNIYFLYTKEVKQIQPVGFQLAISFIPKFAII